MLRLTAAPSRDRASSAEYGQRKRCQPVACCRLRVCGEPEHDVGQHSPGPFDIDRITAHLWSDFAPGIVKGTEDHPQIIRRERGCPSYLARLHERSQSRIAAPTILDDPVSVHRVKPRIRQFSLPEAAGTLAPRMAANQAELSANRSRSGLSRLALRTHDPSDPRWPCSNIGPSLMDATHAIDRGIAIVPLSASISAWWQVQLPSWLSLPR